MSKLGKIFFLFSGLSLLSFVALKIIAGSWIPFLWVCLALFVGFLIGGFWQDREFYKDFLSMKTTKQGMSMGGMILMVFTLLVAVNFIATRKHKTFDFSLAKVNTLSEQSIQLVKNLKEDLKVLYFYQKGAEGVEENRRAFIELLKKYQDQSSYVKLDFVEVNERPDLTEKYGVTKGNGVVFLDYKGKKNQIQKIDEQEITSALVKVTREKDKIIYFTSGHGERDLENQQDIQALGAFKAMLEGNRYISKNLVLISEGKVPDDADVVIIAGPTQGFLDNEVKLLEDYLKKGGSLVLALEPKTSHNLDKILTQAGIVLKNNYLVNFIDTPIGRAIDPRATAGTTFSQTHNITKPFGKSQFTLFRTPMSVLKADKTDANWTYDSLVKTNNKTLSYSDNSFKGEGVPSEDTVVMSVKGRFPGVDEKGPEFSLVVTGDVDFMSNQLLYQNLNRDLALNMVSDLAKEESMISITPKEVGMTQLQITPNQFYLFIFGFILPLPLLLLFMSGFFWYQRRNA